MTGRMAGRTALVVGGGQQPGATYGNGRATAVALAREGAEVTVVDLFADRAGATAAEIVAAGGVAHSIAGDVTSSADCEAFVRFAVERMDRIDVLVNNVGTNAGDDDALHLSEEHWRALIDVNLTSMWFTSRLVIPLMRERGGGAITNISSTASIFGTRRFFAYGVSKAGVNALGHALAIENAPYNIRVNTVLPGLIDTPLGNESYVGDPGVASREEAAAKRANKVPLGRQGTAWDIANAVLYLSSDEASFVTGVTLRVDGGAGSLVGGADWRDGSSHGTVGQRADDATTATGA
jgi:NAD(P)-dependent dehydrogenase (short-subunit alcohol dehydrogenase family)